MQGAQVLSLSPSFNSYSDPKFAGIAARVVHELGSDRGISNNRDPESDNDADDFDFAFVTRNPESSSQIPADEIFQDGKIRPVYPVNSDSGRPKTRHPLGKLFIEEREATLATSTSSSEADETDGPDPTTEERRWKKSASVGRNSRRWNFKSLMNRSQSEGSKDSVVILAHCASARKKEDEKKAREKPVAGGKVRPPPLSHRDCGEKQRSYLPYRLDLVGFFGNVNGMRRKSKQY